MSLTITITNLKNIKELVFEVPRPGAYLLTGNNGSGKTSLLTCLSRLTNSNAFQRGFRSSAHKSLDSHRGASVRYNVNGQNVTYSYIEERWAPYPRRNSGLLANAGYPEVTYVAADGSRVDPLQDEFAPRSVRLTDQSLRNGLNFIFDTDRFAELCYLNLSRGGRSRAYLVRQQQKSGATYYSEKNFSLGELSVLKLLIKLRDIQDGSLVLIDELELAIHPRAQVRLFRYLESIAAEKGLTIIFSTHSVTLIKSMRRKNILFLHQENGVVRCIKGCYPTFALGHIAAGEEVAPDCVIYVEDDSARKCVLAALDVYKSAMAQKNIPLPHVICAALGGFGQILEFIDRAPQMLPASTKIVACLDGDVRDESLADYEKKQDHNKLALFVRLKDRISYLPWTPEVGLVRLILSNPSMHEGRLKEFFGDVRFRLPHLWGNGVVGDKGKAFRDACKSAVHQLCEEIERLTAKSRDRVREDLMRYLVVGWNEDNHSAVKFIGDLTHS